MPYRRRSSGGSLISEIVTGSFALSSNSGNSVEFAGMQHKSSEIVLKRLELDFNCVPTQATQHQVCDLALISKPLADGVPVQADIANERYSIFPIRCAASYSTNDKYQQMDHIHKERNLKVLIPMTNRMYWFVFNFYKRASGTSSSIWHN